MGYLLTGQSSIRKFLKVNFNSGEVSSFFPGGDSQLTFTTNGDFDTTTGLGFLIDYYKLEVTKINLYNLFQEYFFISNYFEINLSTRILYHASRNSFFIFGDLSDINQSWGIREFEIENGTLLFNYSIHHLISTNYAPLNFFKSPEGNLFIIAGSNVTGEISSLLIRVFFTSENETVSDSVMISAANYTGHFFSSNYLYITTSRGNLIKVNYLGVLFVEGLEIIYSFRVSLILNL